MMHLDVCKKDSGKLWHRKPHAGDDGVILNIRHNVAGALSDQSRNIRFLHAAFDVTGDVFVAGDHQGNLFRFDIHKNRFSLIQKTGIPCTALAFTLKRRSEFLVALADYSLKCYDADSKQAVATMVGHEGVIHHISLHASGRYALTSSLDTAQLWDLDTFQRRRKLNVKENVGIVKVFFLPLSNTIMTCFKDDTIFAWEVESLTCKYQLTVPDGKAPHFKAFAASRDGRTLVGGGKSRYLHVWALETKKLLRIVELPTKITTVKQLEFVNDSFDGGSTQVLGVLAQDGIMRFIDLGTCKLLFDIGSLDARIGSVTVSASGRHIVAVMDDGTVKVISVQALTKEVHKPPPPLVKVLKSNKMADSTGGNSTLQNGTGTTSKDGQNSAQWSQDSGEVELPAGLSMPRLMAILKGYGEFPNKYRMFIWRSILRLPENHRAYGALVDKGTHPAFENLHNTYPIKSRKLLRVLQRVLSALAHWAPIFGETDFLPMMAFPFVKLFQNNQLVCFEIVATVLVSWCQHWFEYFPNPPINMLGLIENILAHHDKELLQHFVKYGVTSQLYAWPVLQTLYSEVLTRDEWLKLFDNVFSNQPSFLLMVTVAYSICNRTPLLKCTELDDFQYFFHHRNAVDVGDVVKEAYRLQDTTPDDLQPDLDPATPLTRGQYPVFNKYPKFIVDYQVQERERIRTEEQEYLRQRQLSHELQDKLQRKVEEEEAWYRQQKLLLEAEERRRHLIAEEEQKLADQRTRLAALDRESQVKKLALMDAARRKFLHFQQHHKEAELTRLDDEIRRKAGLRDIETEAALDAAEIQHLELQLQRRAFEQELMRGHLEASHKQRTDTEFRRLQQELEDRKRRLAERTRKDEDRAVRQGYESKLGKVENALADLSMRHDIELMQQKDETSRHQKLDQLNKLTEQNQRMEGEIQDLMATVEQQKLGEAQRRLENMPERQNGYHTHEETSMSLREVSFPSRDTSANFNRNNVRPHDLQEEARRSRSPGPRPYLNDTTSTETTSHFSLDRGREEFESRQRETMNEVRRMRSKLATENRNKRPPSQQSSILY